MTSTATTHHAERTGSVTQLDAAPSRSQLTFLADLLRRAGLTSIPEDVNVQSRRSVSQAIEKLRNETPVADPEAFVVGRLAQPESS
jgi:hypothetical protein